LKANVVHAVGNPVCGAPCNRSDGRSEHNDGDDAGSPANDSTI
jgi:hypothetical protein